MLDVIHEDNHCLVVNKPAGLLSQGDETGDASLVDLAADYLRIKYAKPGNVYVGLIHRLDRPTSGVVLLARTSKAAGRLSEQFREGTVRKTYVAIAEGLISEDAGIWRDRLRKNRSANTVSAVDRDDPDAVEAEVEFRVLGRDRDRGRTLIELVPRTGRSHQLRVQLASRGYPLVGDRKYGAKSTLPASDGGTRVALHAAALEFTHPTRGERVLCSAPYPGDWPSLRGFGVPEH